MAERRHTRHVTVAITSTRGKKTPTFEIYTLRQDLLLLEFCIGGGERRGGIKGKLFIAFEQTGLGSAILLGEGEKWGGWSTMKGQKPLVGSWEGLSGVYLYVNLFEHNYA